MSSTDGYCSLVSFAEGELGTPYVGKKNRDSEKHESVMEDMNKVAGHENTEDVEMEGTSTKSSSALQEELAKYEMSPSSSTLVEPSKKEEGMSKTPSRKAPEESSKKPKKECSKPSSNQLEEPSKKQEKDDKHKKAPPGITKKTPQKEQEEKPNLDIPQEPPKKQITVRRAGDRCARLHTDCRYYIKVLS